MDDREGLVEAFAESVVFVLPILELETVLKFVLFGWLWVL
jgi:hypothetical protein